MTKKNAFRKRKRQGKKETLFLDVANEWLSVKSMSVKSSTYAVYRGVLDRHILPLLGSSAVINMTAADISSFAMEKLKRGRLDKKGGLSTKTVCDMLSIIKSILGYALDMRVITHRINITYPKHQRQSRRVLDRKEQKCLESYLIKAISIN